MNSVVRSSRRIAAEEGLKQCSESLIRIVTIFLCTCVWKLLWIVFQSIALPGTFLSLLVWIPLQRQTCVCVFTHMTDITTAEAL